MKRAALLIIALSIALTGCWEEDVVEEEQGPRRVVAVQVGVTDFLGEREFAGRARAAREAALSFRVAGQLSERSVHVGDYVRKGDTIAVLDPGPFQADVSRLGADLAAAKASFQASDEQYGRIMKLVESGTYSEARGDTARGSRDSSAARVDSVRSALKRAELDLSYTVLNAPYDGRVVAVYAEDFEEVRAKEQIARVLDVSKVEITIDVPETLIAFAPLVDEMTVTFDAFPDVELVGVIKEIGSEASLTTRTYPVTLIMDQPDGVVVLPGMSGRARTSKVSDADQASAIVVPASAVRPMDAGSEKLAVWVVDENTNTVSLKPVEVGRILSFGMEITNGISPGEWIVTAGTFSLQPDQEVVLPSSGSGGT